jgi:hypothetical protein
MCLVGGNIVIGKLQGDFIARLGHEGKLGLLAVRGDAIEIHALKVSAVIAVREQAIAFELRGNPVGSLVATFLPGAATFQSVV